MESTPRQVNFAAEAGEVSVVNTFLHVGPRRDAEDIITSKSAPITCGLPSIMADLDEENTSFGDDESEGGLEHLQTYDSFTGILSDADMANAYVSPTKADSMARLQAVPLPTFDEEHISVVNTFVHVDETKEAEEEILTKRGSAPAGCLGGFVLKEQPGGDDDAGIERYQANGSFYSSTLNQPEDDDTGLHRYQTYDDLSSLNLPQISVGMARQSLDLCNLVGGPAEPSQASNRGAVVSGTVTQPVATMMSMQAMQGTDAVTSLGGLTVPPSNSAISSQPSPQQSPRPSDEASAGSKDAPPLSFGKTAAGLPAVTWNVDGAKLWSKYKQIMSPEFELDLPGAGPQPFKLMILAKETKKRGGHSFLSSKGKSELFLKCEATLPETAARFTCRVKVSCDTTGVEFSRGPISHQFLERHCCALQKDDDWDLLQVVDKVAKRFELCVEVLESKS